MKKNIICSIIFLISFFGNAQNKTKDELLDKVALKVCSCIDSKDLNNKAGKEIEVFLGLCIVKSYGMYKKDFEKINAKYSIDDYENLGEEIGIKLAEICPEIFTEILENESSINVDKNEIQTLTVKGNIKSLSGTDFNFLKIKDKKGKNQKFLWLRNFEGSDKLIDNFDTLIGSKVKIYYQNIECYIPKMKEYYILKEIIKLEFIK